MRNILRFRNPVRKLRGKGDAARDAKQWVVAAALYEAYLSDDAGKGDAPIWVQLGHARKESGDDEGAMRAYRRALELAPEVADTHLQIGHLQKKMGKIDLALASFADALRIDADSSHAKEAASTITAESAASGRVPPPQGADRAEFLLARADACREGRRWGEAIDNYAAHLALRPDDARAWRIWIQLGHARREHGDKEGARRAYEQATQFAPDEAEPQFHLGNVHDDLGDLQAAIAAFAEVVRLDPERAEGRTRLHQLTLRAATRPGLGLGFDDDDEVRLAFPPPRSSVEVAFDPVFPAVYPGLSRRFR